MNQYEIAIAALLHDIGKFKQRAYEGIQHDSFPKEMAGQILPGGASHMHALWTLDFFENDLIPLLTDARISFPDWNWRQIARVSAAHHNPSDSYEECIAEADRLSARYDRVNDPEYHYKRGDYYKKGLKPVFRQISLDDSQQDFPNFIYPIEKMGTESVFPIKSTEEDSLGSAYKQLWNEFLQALISLPNKKDLFVQQLQGILERYTWCIPSATNDKYNDISLYDHSKTTMSIAISLHLYKEKGGKDKPFLFFSADVSGIQPFIFQNLYEHFRGNSKIIRARSFYISIISQAYFLTLCRALGIIPFVDIINTGGKFLAIFPNVEGVIEKLSVFQKEVDNWFYQQFHGNFSIISDYSVSAKQDDISQEKFASVLNEINYGLVCAKKRKFEDQMRIGQNVIQKTYTERPTCKACGARSSDPHQEEEVCSFCAGQIRLGAKLTKTTYFAFQSGEGDFEFFGRKLYLKMSELPKEFDKPIFIYTLNGDTDVYAPWRVNTYVPEENGRVKSFEEIADCSLRESNSGYIGSPLLAFIKIDVDNLGAIFSFGFNKTAFSISRYVVLSRMFHYFFNGVLKSKLIGKYSDFYTILSGGDDIFLVAPWDEASDFILDIEKEFQRFVCKNRDLHFSTGVALSRPKQPINRSAIEAERYLDWSKDHGRNLVTYRTEMSYKELQQVNELSSWLIDRVRSDQSQITRAFLYRFLRYARSAIKVAGKEKTVGMYGTLQESRADPVSELSYISSFHYDLARNIIIKKKGTIINVDEVKELQEIFKLTSTRPELLETILVFSIYQIRERTMRKGENHD